MPGMSQNVCLSQNKRCEFRDMNPLDPLKRSAVNSLEGCIAALFVPVTLSRGKDLITLYR
jgi:hypothetical protein